MSKYLTYGDAVKLLGGEDPAVAAIDRTLGGALALASGGVSEQLINAFDAKRGIVSGGKHLVSELQERLVGATRADRTRRLEGAYAIIAVTAYFQAMAHVRLPFSTAELEMAREEQAQLAQRTSATPLSPDSTWLDQLVGAEVPRPSADVPFEQALVKLLEWYEVLSLMMMRHISGLWIFDRESETDREHIRAAVHSVPPLAVREFQDLYGRLALDIPEFKFWADHYEHQATRLTIRRSLSELESLLTTVLVPSGATTLAAALAATYEAVLDRPILSSEETLSEVDLPTLQEAYLDPDFRMRLVENGSPSEEEWWAPAPIRRDLPEFLTAHLLTSQALGAPIVLLGQPGAGKSALTSILAARLPAQGFVPVRVLLREVAADADVQDQIEAAIRATSHERVEWPAFARSIGSATPVVMFDGFDELLQTTGLSQSDFLVRIGKFQQQEALLGRPLVTIVTTRSAVADRARYPSGTLALRLEPFRPDQIAAWLDVWNTKNAAYFSSRALAPFAEHTAIAQLPLSSQPLLLLMLALYDAVSNSLKSSPMRDAGSPTEGGLAEADLYEELLRSFAVREAAKAGGLLQSESDEVVDDLMQQLSLVAFSMANRRRQWVTSNELDGDLSALGPSRMPAFHGTHRSTLRPGQLAPGRFFFIQRAKAQRDGVDLVSYEFLHATFGEYLVARYAAQLLTALDEQHTRMPTGNVVVNDDAQYALLSFSPLSSRQSLRFLETRLQKGLGDDRRAALMKRLLAVHSASGFRDYNAQEYRDYRPAHVTIASRHAVYSANIVLALLMVAKHIRASDLYPHAQDPPGEWHREVLLWRSALRENDWADLASALAVERWRGQDQRDLTIRAINARSDLTRVDPFWLYKVNREDGKPTAWRRPYWRELEHGMSIATGTNDGVVLHALEPVYRFVGSSILTFVELPDGRSCSVANALLDLFLSHAASNSDGDLAEAFLKAVKVTESLPDWASEERRVLISTLVDVAGQANTRLPLATLTELAEVVLRITPAEGDRCRRDLATAAYSALAFHRSQGNTKRVRLADLAFALRQPA